MRVILIGILLVTSSLMCANANIALQMSFYNSDDEMAMSLEGENLAFESFCALEPDSLLYDNGGSSKQPDAHYSYSLSLNGETIFSSAKTDSGTFGWSGHIDAGGDSGANSLGVSPYSAVKDGTLNIAYGNNEFQVQETVKTVNSGYGQKAQLSPGAVVSSGSGSTLKPVPGLAENLLARTTNQASTSSTKTNDDTTTGKGKTSESSIDPKTGDEDQEGTKETPELQATSGKGSNQESATESIASGESQPQGIEYSINVQNGVKNKHGSIEADIMGPTEAQWLTQVNYDSNGYFFGARARGIGLAPIDELGMIGQATGFPKQILPPGNVEISYKDKPGPEIDSFDAEDYAEFVAKESLDFDSEYPGKSTPALWYYLNNLYQNKVPVDPQYTSGNRLLPLEQYQLSMAFDVGGNTALGNDPRS
jgi:hypothetical protein